MKILRFFKDILKNNESQPEEPKAVNNQAENQIPNKFNQPTTTKPNKAVISKPIQDDKYKAHYEAFDKWLCPHCAHQFEKEVTRKRKCPSCQNTLLVRTHHESKRKMILKEEQLPEYEKERTKYYKDKWIEDFFNKYGTTLEEEHSKTGSGSPYPYDIAWGMLNRVAMERASEMKFGLYRNVRMDMGDLLKQEGKLKHSLLFYLEVCFLDINGATNATTHPELMKEYPPFRLESAFLAPGILAYIETLSEELNLSLEDIKEEFINHNKRSYKDNVLVPLSAEKAWLNLEKELLERKEEFAK
ncbi:hypothetical protein [Bacillus sp. V5-8f]|uniref:hypothetical protein n=1 Tax=Bacillus sp. V5-8f TaxID=2053044 RepID=UPI000C7867DC|nr:hypothetical protein [Bacillus sp. V5-8f]PLT31987.1 hypothetical protein CUU64_20590 [Bacillus sp. V5-8f]